jgi:hypothetical protein
VGRFSHRRGYDAVLTFSQEQPAAPASLLKGWNRLLDVAAGKSLRFSEVKDLDFSKGTVRIAPFGISPQSAEDPLFKPASAADFLKNREALLSLFQDDAFAVPYELELTPFTDSLRWLPTVSEPSLDLTTWIRP